MKEFSGCESEFKHQFFAASVFGGHLLALVDVTRSQTGDAQKKIQTNLDKAFYKESKKVASHIHLAVLIKRKLR